MRARALASLERWVDQCVIGQYLCPFAKPVRTRDTLRFTLTPESCTTLESLLKVCGDEVDRLVQLEPAVETTIIGAAHNPAFLR